MGVLSMVTAPIRNLVPRAWRNTLVALAAFNWLLIGLLPLIGMEPFNLLQYLTGFLGGLGGLLLNIVYVLAGVLAVPLVEDALGI